MSLNAIPPIWTFGYFRAEEAFSGKLRALQARHESEIQGGGEVGAEDAVRTNTAGDTEAASPPTTEESSDEAEKRKKQEKLRLKREKVREKERERERKILEETANAGPTPRDVEMKAIEAYLEPLNLQVKEVLADGHCLYRAVGAQCGRDHNEISKLIPSSAKLVQILDANLMILL